MSQHQEVTSKLTSGFNHNELIHIGESTPGLLTSASHRQPSDQRIESLNPSGTLHGYISALLTLASDQQARRNTRTTSLPLPLPHSFPPLSAHRKQKIAPTSSQPRLETLGSSLPTHHGHALVGALVRALHGRHIAFSRPANDGRSFCGVFGRFLGRGGGVSAPFFFFLLIREKGAWEFPLCSIIWRHVRIRLE